MSSPAFRLPSARSTLLAAACAGALSACAPMPSMAPAYGPPPSSAFSADAFTWSTRQGQASIVGVVNFARDGRPYQCTGSVALTPDTPYTRARFYALYGSTELAAVPEAVVRARTVADPNADYRSFVRSTTCTGGRFDFPGLPDGSWFVITPVSPANVAGGERIVLMRRVETRGGRMLNVIM